MMATGEDDGEDGGDGGEDDGEEESNPRGIDKEPSSMLS